MMNAFQRCGNTSDTVPLYLPQQLFLKPVARLNISVQLPNVKKLGKCISHWEMMEKIRQLITPDEFTVLKVSKSTLEFVRFEAEIELKSKVERILSKLDHKTIKMTEFSELMRIRAAEQKQECPTRRVWDAFFQEARDMDETKPGERPDTMYLSNLPVKWFIPYHLSDEEDVTPSEKIFYRIFEKFGDIRYVDIPMCDPYRKKMKESISGFKKQQPNKDCFEGYVQFKDYIGFTRAMDAFRNMKLLHKNEDDEAFTADIIVDFDRHKHLSDASIRRREIVRDRLVRKAKEQEEKDKKELEDKKRQEEIERQKQIDKKNEKEIRRRLREEKRKEKILKKLEINGSDEINEKIAKEEKKLLKVQRRLEAIRLIEELFRRIKDKIDEDHHSKVSTKNQAELMQFKNASELEVLNQREILHNALKGRVMLKTILSSSKKSRKHSSSSSNSSKNGEEPNLLNQIDYTPTIPPMYDPSWYTFPYQMHTNAFYPPVRGVFRGGRGLRHLPGPSRGFPKRSRGGYRPPYRGHKARYPPEIEEEYRKYFNKFLHEHDNRTKSRSRSTDRRRSRSRSHRRSYSRSYSRSRSRDRSHRRSKRSYSKSESRSRSRSRRRRRSSRDKRSRSRSTKSKSKSRSLSVDSTKFMTPKQLRQARSRSKSWSMPKDGEDKERSWSKTPEKKD